MNTTPAPAPEPPPKPAAPVQPAVKKTILLAEDDPVTVTLLEAKLKEKGYDLVIANDGKNALTLAQSKNPDLIISDIVMPEMNGYEFYKALKRNNTTNTIPVLILTGYSKMTDTFAVMGADEFILKPIDMDKLLEKITILLARERKAVDPAAPSAIPQASTQPVALPVTPFSKKNLIIGAVILVVLIGLYFLVSSFSAGMAKKKTGIVMDAPEEQSEQPAAPEAPAP